MAFKKFKRGEYLKEYLDDKYLCARIGKKVVDFSYKIKGDEKKIILLGFDSREGKQAFWHTASHILAQAVKELFPSAKLAIGPPIENGFYYDFLVDKPFTQEDLEDIEKKMKEIVKRDLELSRKEISVAEAEKFFKDESLKLELIREFEDETLSIYKQGEFVDLCKGPHILRTGLVKYIKLLSTSASYWRGDERGPVLQRIYGIAFLTQEELKQYLKLLEEAKKRDHRKLGRELELFTYSEEIGPALILWHPKGAMIRRIIENFLFEEHTKRGYLPVYTPHIGKKNLWEISGHLDYYRENMYPEMEFTNEEGYFIKPMNCPFHIQIYRSSLKSYRDLPLGLFEFGTVYRLERSGVLHGLARVRGFTQDDAHIFCTPLQVEEEIKKVIEFALFVLKKFGFKDYKVFVSTQPERYVGTDEMWEKATRSLLKAAEHAGLEFEIDEGAGAFYGPKIDILIKDALRREWQCTTIQFDFNLPERFELTFRDRDGKDKRPYMIHRALIGSFERFFGVLIEHYAGNFPLWLAPLQLSILPITNRQNAYAREIQEILKSKKLRVEVDTRNEKLGYKISESERQKIPYMIVVGQKEEKSRSISLRKHGEGDKGRYTIDQLMDIIAQELKNI